MYLERKIEKDQKIEEYLEDLCFSKKDIYLLKLYKKITVNNVVITNTIILKKDDIICIDISLQENSTIKAIKYDLEIAYEDDIVLVVEKPYDLIIHDDSTSTITLDNYIAGYYQKTNQHHNVYHVHRLDKQTTGLILYCKEPLLNNYFSTKLENKDIKRTYLALVEGIINKPIIIDKAIGKDRHISNKYRVNKNGKKAITKISPIKQIDDSTLIKCELLTGRTHQIRVHLSSINHTIVGDRLYGSKSNQRLMLHSYQLSFVHPITNKEITIISKNNLI